jgi:hypothetical protein
MIATSTVLGISKLPGRNVAPGSGNPRPSGWEDVKALIPELEKDLTCCFEERAYQAMAALVAAIDVWLAEPEAKSTETRPAATTKPKSMS